MASQTPLYAAGTKVEVHVRSGGVEAVAQFCWLHEPLHKIVWNPESLWKWQSIQEPSMTQLNDKLGKVRNRYGGSACPVQSGYPLP